MTAKFLYSGMISGFLLLAGPAAEASFCIASSVELTGSRPVPNRLLLQGSNYSSTVVYYLSASMSSTYWLSWHLDGSLMDESPFQPLVSATHWVTNSGGSFTAPGPGVHTYTFTADSRAAYGDPNSVSIRFAVATSFFELAEGFINGDESSRLAEVVVWRYGQTNTPASIRLAVSNITASASDYVAPPTLLNWAAGDPPAKTVSVSVVDDALAEGSETFAIRLHTPAGATTGATTLAIVTLGDNDSGNVSVTLTPPEAVAEGAMWQLDSSGWRASGVLSGVVTGLHTVSFKAVSGWIAPTSRTVTVTPFQTTALTLSYEKLDTGTLADAVDAPALAFTLSGNGLWFRQTTNTHDGADAAESGNIGDGGRCALMTTVQGPGTLSYWWSLSAENGDELSLYIDGILQPGQLYGVVPWQCRTNILSPGPHALKWEYAKDNWASLFSDCGRLDQIVWTPLVKPPVASNPSPAHLAAGIATNVLLAWAPSARAEGYRVYAGTNATPPFRGTTTSTNFPAPPLGFSRTCYWRVDATNAAGVTNGPVWRFTTLAATRILGLSGTLDFGPVASGQTATASMTLTNSGNDALTVTSLAYPAGFSGAWSGSIPAGGSRTVTVTFAPTALQSYSGTVTVNSDKTAGGNTLPVSGTGIGRVIGLAGNLSFGQVVTGLTATATLVITNRGNAALAISSISYPAAFSGAWSGSIPAGGSRSVTVTFAPSAIVTYGGPVTVNSDRTSGGNTISASGSGIARAIGVTGNLAFGNVETGQTASAFLTIQNNGNATLTVASITYPAGFSGAWAGPIAPGGNQAVTVTFAPAAVQAYGGTVTVVSDKTSGWNEIGCSGTGTVVATRILGLSGNLSFGSVVTGLTAAATLTLTNTGNAALTVSSLACPAGFSGNWSGVIPPGGGRAVTITFAPTALQSYGGSVTVYSDRTAGGHTLAASGLGIGRVLGLSGPLAFGTVVTGQTAEATLTIRNHGNAVLTVLSLACPPGFSGSWSGAIPPYGTQTVAVTFAPAAVQVYDGTVTVNSDRTSGGNTIATTGRGGEALTRIIGLPGILDFGGVPTGRTATAALTITNSGTGPLTVLSIAYPDGFSGAWSGLVAPGGTQEVTVTFAPLVMQSYTGTVTVESDRTGGENTFLIQGSGTVPPPAGKACFGAATAVAWEGKIRTFNVYRTGGSNGAASVQCATVPKTALPWKDFKPVNRTLTWRDGDAGVKKVSLNVYADGLTEGAEKLIVALKNPVGLALAVPYRITVTIAANAKSGSGAADPDAARMVRLAEALDAEELTWFASAQAPWEARRLFEGDGGLAARAGLPLPGGFSWLETEVEGPGALRFDWLLRGGGDARGLLLVNGKIRETLGPVESWEAAGVRLDPGAQTVRWIFMPGAVPSLFLLDRVEWAPDEPDSQSSD